MVSTASNKMATYLFSPMILTMLVIKSMMLTQTITSITMKNFTNTLMSAYPSVESQCTSIYSITIQLYYWSISTGYLLGCIRQHGCPKESTIQISISQHYYHPDCCYYSFMMNLIISFLKSLHLLQLSSPYYHFLVHNSI